MIPLCSVLVCVCVYVCVSGRGGGGTGAIMQLRLSNPEEYE